MSTFPFSNDTLEALKCYLISASVMKKGVTVKGGVKENTITFYNMPKKT